VKGMKEERERGRAGGVALDFEEKRTSWPAISTTRKENQRRSAVRGREGEGGKKKRRGVRVARMPEEDGFER